MEGKAITPRDREWMARALQLARRGDIGTAPNPRVGCILVRNNGVLAEGWHHRIGGPHAEVVALDALANRNDAKGATAYVTLEPCSHHGRTPPCSSALIDAGIARCVVGLQDPNPLVEGRGLERMRDAGITVAVLNRHPEGRWLNRRFLSSMERGRPWVVLKCAVSADGHMDPPRGPGQLGSLPITSASLRKLTHRWRAEEGAILVGAGTVITDDPRLNVREADGPHPLPVVLDPNGRTPATAALYTSGASCWVMGGPEGVAESVDRHRIHPGEDAFQRALAALHNQGVRSVLVEGGRQTLQHILDLGLWDELRVARSPGSTGGGLPAPTWPTEPADAVLRGAHPFGPDRVQYWVNAASLNWVGCCPPPTLQIPMP